MKFSKDRQEKKRLYRGSPFIIQLREQCLTDIESTGNINISSEYFIANSVRLCSMAGVRRYSAIFPFRLSKLGHQVCIVELQLVIQIDLLSFTSCRMTSQVKMIACRPNWPVYKMLNSMSSRIAVYQSKYLATKHHE